MYKYIVESAPHNNQLIVSGIGYEDEKTFGVSFDKVITLTNERYALLCEEDYCAYKGLLSELCAK